MTTEGGVAAGVSMTAIFEETAGVGWLQELSGYRGWVDTTCRKLGMTRENGEEMRNVGSGGDTERPR